MQMREPTGFARLFSAQSSQKNPGIQQVFPDFFILPGQKTALAKLLRTAKSEIFVSGKAKSAGILDMYSEHFQRSPARKDPFCGCRIPDLHALTAPEFF